MKNPLKTFWVILLVAVTISCSLYFLNSYKFLIIPGIILLVSRWLILIILFYYAVVKRSLTVWILVSLFAGIEFGHDVPSIAIKLDVISQIFLRLIKTIIGPLLFGTLVVGIGMQTLSSLGGSDGSRSFILRSLPRLPCLSGWLQSI
jgi:proton glutamate symport protein